MYSPSKCWKNGGQGWNVSSVVYVSTEDETRFSEVRGTRRSGDKAATVNPPPRKCFIQEVKLEIKYENPKDFSLMATVNWK